MILDEKETYQLSINKWRIGFNLLIMSFVFYKVPQILYRRWQLNTLSPWSILYVILTIFMLLITIRLSRILFSSGLILEMDDAGIKTKKFGFVAWNMVQDIKVNKDKMILIFLTHSDAFSEALNVSKLQRKLMDALDKKEGTPFTIQIAETNYKAAEFEAALAKFRK